MTRPVRVLIVMPLAEQRGGAEKMLQHLLVHARPEQVRWHVVFLEQGPMAAWAAERNIPVTVVEAGRLRNPLDYGRAVGALVRLARSWRPDVLFAWMTKAHLYTGVAARIAGLPATWFHHSISDGSLEQRLITLLPAAWVAVPSEVAARAQRRLPGCPACHVVYPGIDIAEFTAEALPPAGEVRAEFAIAPGARLVGTVARLQRWKGVHVLLGAAALAARTCPDLHVMVVGGAHFSEPAYPDELRAMVTKLGLSGRVTFTGHRPDVARLVNAFDLFVHASTEPEPGGMTVMEAMALGKPVIATRAGGPTETVVDGVTGLLVPPADAIAMGEALVRLCSDPDLGLSFRQAAMDRAREQFSAPVMADRIVALLQQAGAAVRT